MNASVPARSKQSAGLGRSQATFPSHGRLLRHSDFERVYKVGRRHFSASITVFYWLRVVSQPHGVASTDAVSNPGASGFRVGFTVSRALGGAVQRNRMKRRLREAVRLSWPAHELDADIVINPKKSVLKIEFEALLKEVRRAFVVIADKLGGASHVAPEADKGTPEG